MNHRASFYQVRRRANLNPLINVGRRSRFGPAQSALALGLCLRIITENGWLNYSYELFHPQSSSSWFGVRPRPPSGKLRRPGQPAADSPAEQIIKAATNTDFAYRRLATLCDTFGPRHAGSTNLEAALDWLLQEMKKDGLANVHGEPVMVPPWVRGAESAEMLPPRRTLLPMLGLGNSVGTPPEGITAEVLVVTNFADLHAHAAAAAGKIVLINQPFDGYGKTVRIRRDGAVEAAQAGAVASLIRSVTPVSLNTPHTGAMTYSNGIPKIPHAAITIEDADMMQRMQERGQKITVHLQMSAQTLPDAPSRNVIGEVRGRDLPDEVIIVSGHIDSWDVGQGAEDDGGGAMSAWEAVRVIKQLGLRPRRTIRVVLWTDEENGGSGAKTYEKEHKAELPKHLLAIESDSGAYRPLTFTFARQRPGAGQS